MQVDKITLQDIGLFDSEDHPGLASHLNFCRSNGGKFYFDQLLGHPLSNQQAILERQDAISFFIEHHALLSAQKTTNGTTLVIDKFFETGFKTIPAQISMTGAVWYKYVHKNDYSLIKYSIEHLVLFITDMQEWAAVFEKHTNNPIIKKLQERVYKISNHPSLNIIPLNKKLDKAQVVLQLAHFFSYQYKHNIRELLSLYYEIDAFYSMSTAMRHYSFQFPVWREDQKPYFKTEAAVHPLVKNAISNNLSLDANSNFLFLTGANMAGKSTFIKTIGIVIYLSHIGMGAPAKYTELTVMDGLITNLTIADNVIKGESYFYNEVLSIKNTAEKIKDGKKYCVLIDELFKGTNIQDAMKCSAKVIEGLQKLKSSLFILSTHLYEISENLKKYTNIQFCYFETIVKDKDLVFHYTLQKGVSNDRIGYLILEREGVVDLLDSF
jgi:DNA mismatch repair ATPase MutS